MPELPEVETIARFLREGGRNILPIPGRVVDSAELLWKRTLQTPTVAQLERRITGQKVQAVSRRGKFLVFSLTKDTLLIHLRMSGDLRCEPERNETGAPLLLQSHDRMVIHFKDGTRMVFNDARKFGRVWLTNEPDSILGNLGPEPFDPKLSSTTFFYMLKARKRQLKPLLLDQTFIAGLGNIYTDEALHLSRLHPLKNTSSLSPNQAKVLLESIRQVLGKGIRRNGASIDWVYRGGDFQNDFRVYQRTGEPCPQCGTPVERIVVGQRGTHFCPVCQPLN